jgi:hypothetical protein
MNLYRTIANIELERRYNQELLEKLLELSDERIAKEQELRRMLQEEFEDRDRALERLIGGADEDKTPDEASNAE